MDGFENCLYVWKRKILDDYVKLFALQAWPALTAFRPPLVLGVCAALWAKSRSRQ